MFPNYTKYCIKTVDWRAVFLFQEQQLNFLKIMFIKVESGIYLFGFLFLFWVLHFFQLFSTRYSSCLKDHFTIRNRLIHCISPEYRLLSSPTQSS